MISMLDAGAWGRTANRRRAPEAERALVGSIRGARTVPALMRCDALDCSDPPDVRHVTVSLG